MIYFVLALALFEHRDYRRVWAKMVADGGRWSMSAVLLPDTDATARLATLTAQATPLAGPGQWPTGAPDAVHFTVRAIEVHRSVVPPTDPLAGRIGRWLA